MAFIINDDCINCGACAVECPVDAVFEPGNNSLRKSKMRKALSSVHYFIDLLLCNECGSKSEQKCVEVCPMDSIKKINSTNF